MLSNSLSKNSGKKRSRSPMRLRSKSEGKLRSIDTIPSPIKIMLAITVSLALLFISCWGLLVNHIWITAIAPAFGLILAAIIALGYSSFQEDGLRY